MNFEAEHKAIEARLENNWTETAIAFDNIEFQEQGREEFIRLTILDGASKQASLEDKPLYRNIGLIAIQIFVRPGSGLQRAEKLGDMLAEIYRGAQFSGITCKAPQYQRVGEKENWFQVNLNIPFYMDNQET